MRPAGRRVGGGRAVGRDYGGLARAACRGGGKGPGMRRGDRVVRRVGVGSAEPAVAGRRDRRRPGRPRTYLKHVLGEHYDAARVDALLDAGRHMVSFFEQNTALQFVSGTWIADIQGHVPGAGTGGRSVGPKPVHGRALGGHLLDKLRSQLYETSFLGLGIMAGPDLQAFLHATRSPRAFAHAGWRGRVPSFLLGPAG